LIGLEEKEREEIWKKIIPIADSYCPLYSSIYVDSPVNFLSSITWMCTRAPLVYAGDYNGTDGVVYVHEGSPRVLWINLIIVSCDFGIYI